MWRESEASGVRAGSQAMAGWLVHDGMDGCLRCQSARLLKCSATNGARPAPSHLYRTGVWVYLRHVGLVPDGVIAGEGRWPGCQQRATEGCDLSNEVASTARTAYSERPPYQPGASPRVLLLHMACMHGCIYLIDASLPRHVLSTLGEQQRRQEKRGAEGEGILRRHWVVVTLARTARVINEGWLAYEMHPNHRNIEPSIQLLFCLPSPLSIHHSLCICCESCSANSLYLSRLSVYSFRLDETHRRRQTSSSRPSLDPKNQPRAGCRFKVPPSCPLFALVRLNASVPPSLCPSPIATTSTTAPAPHPTHRRRRRQPASQPAQPARQPTALASTTTPWFRTRRHP